MVDFVRTKQYAQERSEDFWQSFKQSKVEGDYHCLDCYEVNIFSEPAKRPIDRSDTRQMMPRHKSNQPHWAKSNTIWTNSLELGTALILGFILFGIVLIDTCQFFWEVVVAMGRNSDQATNGNRDADLSRLVARAGSRSDELLRE